MKAHSSRAKKTLHSAKPFCECKRCTNKNCPNVLQKLGLRDKAPVKGSKVVSRKEKTKKEPNEKKESDQESSLLGMLNPDRTCNCEVMARALNSDIHMNIGTLINRDHFTEEASNSKQSDDPKTK
ncbi:hypothetical protein evm_000289 [Chilo suppressalis]|nr:hypothetical protein evm_000289 [Chilo suppressalis]